MNYQFYNPYMNPTNYQNIPNTQAPAINQTFQLAQNNNEFDGKMANSLDEVKGVLALRTTLFINKDKSMMWIKDTTGAVKEYKLEEVVELDEKDKKIISLERQVQELKEMMENAKRTNATQIIREPKSTESNTIKATNVYGNESAKYSSANDSKYIF